jgi:hypothetical protein
MVQTVPYQRYEVKCSSDLRMVASGWSGQKEYICPSIKKSMVSVTGKIIVIRFVHITLGPADSKIWVNS